MAQKVITTLVDDLTDEELQDGAGTTVHFGFDGNNYEIDLSNDNADKFREAFSDYIAAARKVGASASRPTSSGLPRSLAGMRTSSRRSASGPTPMATRSPPAVASHRASATPTTRRTDLERGQECSRSPGPTSLVQRSLPARVTAPLQTHTRYVEPSRLETSTRTARSV